MNVHYGDLSVQQVKIPSWTCLYSDVPCDVITLFRKHELELMFIYLGNSLFTFVFGRLRFHGGGFPRGANVIKSNIEGRSVV